MQHKNIKLSALVLSVLAVATIWIWNDRGESHLPHVVGEVTRLESLGAELLVLDAQSITRRGSNKVLVVRFDGPVEFAPYHFAEAELHLEGPQPIEDWAKTLGVSMVFNAGQFDEKLQHIGWLKRDGHFVREVFKPQWKGLLLSGPNSGRDQPWSRIADLELAPKEIEESYRHVVQSMMLIDDQGKLRVRESEKDACRTVVAEDRKGRPMVIITEGAVTLAEFGRWLGAQDLGIVRAMNLDGGIESQLFIHTEELQLSFYGQWGTGTTMLKGAPGRIRYPLPAVVAVRALTAK